MLCYVSLPNNVILEVEVDPKANGQECLEKVCHEQGIIELGYFGLQYKGNKGENLWLNVRNRITREVSGPTPYKFQLRVKFFVQPHLILQESTRHLFYLQVKQELKSNKLQINENAKLAKIIALMSQAEYGEQVNNCHQFHLYKSLLDRIADCDDEILGRIAIEHSKLHGITKCTAEYRVLQESSELQNYGMEYHEAKTTNCDLIGVGPDGIFIYNTSSTDSSLQETIQYALVQKAVHNGRRCSLYTYTDNGEIIEREFRMISHKAANALYRCITEMHSFFRCDTVNNAVSTQVSRDLKGILASLFHENTTLGQDYVFDVKQTCREVYDNTKRTLLKQETDAHNPTDELMEEDGEQHSDKEPSDTQVNECELLKQKLERIQDSFMCRVCMDAEISTVLIPCGHIVCCNGCALQLTECPLCRTGIQIAQKAFLPSSVLTKTS
ncbi:hypothetical protein KUTeg_019871 [Tegillarca granosa]|uniref:RING-type E3 ubiquitin transferase n=1 Tax=Tegillarca granosa TaxID=220873 RepID=A0ABQ9EIX4_TEGGR|nr:hypothetical protein KUTeg_019871 [Tegillarca granosa]